MFPTNLVLLKSNSEHTKITNIPHFTASISLSCLKGRVLTCHDDTDCEQTYVTTHF